ncbi:uncharacterized protein M6B38_285555 [Iris pallida]|uniref:Uncharacterized protein n=1 Tax=Iris pallida TaxID=29817 RepID=A0AAX6HY90_IRIPA|nr:uncharacterized protein M6B38_285555 [Iris pallida]
MSPTSPHQQYQIWKKERGSERKEEAHRGSRRISALAAGCGCASQAARESKTRGRLEAQRARLRRAQRRGLLAVAPRWRAADLKVAGARRSGSWKTARAELAAACRWRHPKGTNLGGHGVAAEARPGWDA